MTAAARSSDAAPAAHDRVYRGLRTRIMHGEIAPGQALTLRGIGKQFEVSMTPAREAVRRLVAEGALFLSSSGRVSTPELAPERIEELAKDPQLDRFLRPLEEGLADLPELKCTAEGAARLRNGNPGMVLAAEAEYGDEAWASFDGRAVAVGIYKAGQLHPSRVFNQTQPA